MYVYFVCNVMHVYHVCLVPAEEGVGSPRTGVKDGCELPYGCWESNLSSPGEQSVHLTSP